MDCCCVAYLHITWYGSYCLGTYFILLLPHASISPLNNTSVSISCCYNNPTQNSWLKTRFIIAHESVGQVGSSTDLGRPSWSWLGLFMHLWSAGGSAGGSKMASFTCLVTGQLLPGQQGWLCHVSHPPSHSVGQSKSQKHPRVRVGRTANFRVKGVDTGRPVIIAAIIAINLPYSWFSFFFFNLFFGCVGSSFLCEGFL